MTQVTDGFNLGSIFWTLTIAYKFGKDKRVNSILLLNSDDTLSSMLRKARTARPGHFLTHSFPKTKLLDSFLTTYEIYSENMKECTVLQRHSAEIIQAAGGPG